jgi:hypothetical protein
MSGSRLTFASDVKGGGKGFALLDHLKIMKLTVSLGGTETPTSHPVSMTIERRQFAHLPNASQKPRMAIGHRFSIAKGYIGALTSFDAYRAPHVGSPCKRPDRKHREAR